MVQENPGQGVKLRINPKTPDLPYVQRELRALQGLLAIFGLHSINLANPEIEWIPESEEEHSQLSLFSFSSKTEPLPDDQLFPLPLDLLARAVIAADAATDIEVPLNFFRRGMLDVYDRNYIEAIYDFYFILESEFGEGQFKKAAVLTAFLKSNELRSCVQQAIAKPSLMLLRDVRIRAEFENSYAKMTAENAIKKIVELRGYLHHHTKKRRDNWHPEDQRRFEVDALFLQAVSCNLVLVLVEPYLWDDKAL